MNYSHIALSASAGSGKTFMLSVRFIALILDGAKLSDIIALTFTKKAVGEMKERIEEVFCKLENKNAELAQLVEILGFSEAEILRRRDERMAEFLSAELKIFTFDSFFSRILRLFASYLGLRPDFELTDSQDKSAAFLASLSEQDAQEILEMLAEFDISLSNFLDSLGTIYENFTGNFIYPQELKTPSLRSTYERLREYFSASNSKHVQNWLTQLDESENIFIQPLFKLLGSSTALKIAEKDPTFAAALDELASQVCNFLAAKEAKILKMCFKYAQIYAASARKMHQETGVLSFSDVAIYVHQILNNKELKDLFYFRLNCDLKHLLIDEFQDTSIIQYEIIRPLVEEITAGLGIDDAPKSFFYVGDKKQSIYSFRGANQAVFDLFANEKKFNIQKHSLDTNYRSHLAVVEFCNEIFSKSAYQNEFIPAIAAKASGGEVKIFEYPNKSKDYLELILQSIQRCNAQVCILVRTNAKAEEIAQFLAENNIPVASASSKKLVDDLNVRVLLEFAKYCVFGDEAYLQFVKSVLKSIPERLNIDILRPAKETFMFLAQALKLEITQNLLEFITHAEDKFLDNLYEESSATCSNEIKQRVVIMTVHKSKGLQFENVICLHAAGLDRHKSELKLNYDFDKSAWDGMLISNSDLEKLRITHDSEYAKKAAKVKKAKEEDELNGIYVAYTRAIKRLVIIKDEKVNLCVQLPPAQDFEEWRGDIDSFSQPELLADNHIDYDFIAQIPTQRVKNHAFSDEINLGLAFHYFCELSDFQQVSIAQCVQLAHERFRLAPLDKLKTLAEQICSCESFLALISNKVLIKEQSFQLENTSGRIDLIAYDENEICIIDYKSGANSPSYKAQLLGYKNALIACDFASMINATNPRIRCFLLIHAQNGEFELEEIS